MLSDLAADVAGPVLVALLVGGLAALGLSLRVAPAALDRYAWLYAALAVIVAAGLGWLVLYATGEDTYYTPGDVSRWDHTTRSGSSLVVVAAIAIALASIIALVLCACSASRVLLRRIVMPATALACVTLVVASVALTIGH